MTESYSKKDPLDNELNNQDAINNLMEVFNIDHATATNMWQRYIETVRKMKKSEAEMVYAKAERQVIINFALAVPDATGRSKIAKDFIRANIARSFVELGLDISGDSESILFEAFDSAFVAYAALSKIGDEE